MGAGDAGVEQGELVLAEAVERFSAALGPRLLAAYALGSLAHGGFSSLVSDVDLGVVLADPIIDSDDVVVQDVADAIKAGPSFLHQRVSVFWGSPATLTGAVSGGRFPPLDRLDLLEHGRLLLGSDIRIDLPTPTYDELLLEGAEFALDFLGGRTATEPRSGLGSMVPNVDAIHEIRRPSLLLERGPRRLTKIVLFPVRFLFTAATGRVGTNELAVEHHRLSAEAPAKDLVTAAHGWRFVPPADPAFATELLDRELLSLYLHYIDDHISRVAALGRRDLADDFSRWRARLVD